MSDHFCVFMELGHIESFDYFMVGVMLDVLVKFEVFGVHFSKGYFFVF